MKTEELLKMAINFHGHKCPAMPLGLRAGLLALKKLGVKRASNKELFCFLESGFVRQRKQGIQPKDISPEIVDPIIENVMKQPDDILFKVGDVFDIELEKQKGTFDWEECEDCGEIVFSHGLRLKNGKKLCIPCFEENI